MHTMTNPRGGPPVRQFLSPVERIVLMGLVMFLAALIGVLSAVMFMTGYSVQPWIPLLSAAAAYGSLERYINNPLS
jgi:CHASE2 domain-containing sensor protein